MIQVPTRWLRFGLAVLLAASPVLAHEDDPKLRDKQPPVPGPGWRRTSPLTHGGGTNGPSGFESDGVQLLAWMPMSELDNSSGGNDCWGYTSPSGREYAIIGTGGGTVFVEISNPSSPQRIAIIDGPDSLWRDIKVFQQYAYIVSEGGSGIQIVSMANIDAGQVTLVNTVTTGGGTATHNVAIDTASGFLYRCGGDNNGIRVYNLNTSPTNPPFVGSWSTRYIHDIQVVTYTSGPMAGKQIGYACSGLNGGWTNTGLDILDVTNKSSITVLAHVFYNDPNYSHQGWLSPDQQYFYLGDELDEDGAKFTTTHVYNVSNPASPVYLGDFDNGNLSVGHNMYTKGNLLYEANYRSGLRVFDTSSPTNPTEVAWFDTYPGSDNANFNGLWSTYPYFPSGTVIGSDLERGLFVWWVGPAPIDITFPNGVPPTLNPAGDSVAVQITESHAGDLAIGTERLFYNPGSGWIEVPLVAQGGGLYSADFPALPCGSAVQWYVGAESQNGIFWSKPEGAPTTSFAAFVANSITTLANYDMETTAGWTAGYSGDDATAGVWTRVDPNGTAAQPEDDTTPGGTRAWITGQNASGDVGGGDVDGGTTTLVSPILALGTAVDPYISYWRWFSNNQGSNPNEDVFRIDLSLDNGSSWTNVETIGPNGSEAGGGWFSHSFRVRDFGTPTALVKMRFVASDLGGGSIVEAAIDDFQVVDLDCSGCSIGNYCQATPNSTGFPGLISYFGSPIVPNNDFGLIADQCPPNQFGIFFYGPNQNSVPFGNGFLCVSGALVRFPVTTVDVFGQVIFAVDQNNLPGGDTIDPGETVNFQFWYRDPMGGGSSFNLTDALTVDFCQ